MISRVRPIESIGVSRPKATKYLASLRSPAMNCGPTFMPTENMKRLKKSVLAKSGTLKSRAKTALERRLRVSVAISVEAVVPSERSYLDAAEQIPRCDRQKQQDEGLCL